MKTPLQLARAMRKNPTQEENFLWQLLRRKDLDGHKFLRQHPLFYYTYNEKQNFYIADFYCHKKKLVVEMDGGIHKLKTEEDKIRDEVLREKGIRTLRITNDEFNTLEIHVTLDRIRKALKEKI